MNCQKSVDESGNSSEATINASPRDPKEFVAHIQLCCRLKSLLSKKRLLKKGDTPETHAEKVDKLKVLLESLYNSAYKTEKRILEHREQKKEILNFRVARTSEVRQIEKDLEAEVSLIEKKRNELEAELRKVNSTLAAANARLQDAREERLQFDKDNNEFLIYLKEKEDELSKTIYSYRAEADRCDAFINFLETTWDFQSSFVKQRDKQVNDQLQNHEAYFINAATSFLSTFKDQLEPAIADLRKILEGLNGYQYIIDPAEEFLQDIKQRESFEQEYLDAEAKVINIFHAVQSIKELFYGTIDDASRKGVQVVNELCSAIENIRRDFKTIKRPILRIEISTNEEEFSPATGSPQGVMILSPGRVIPDLKSIFTQKLIKSPKQKPYIPLGGSPENSPLSNKGNDTIFSENKHHKSEVWESERPSHIDKDVSNLTLKMENKTLEEMSPGQEKQLHRRSILDLDKELVKPALQKETGMNTMATEGGHKKLFETSTGNAEKLPDYMRCQMGGKEFQLSTSNDKKSVDPDVELSKSTSGIKADEFSTEELVGRGFNKPVNEHKKTGKLARLKTF